MIFINTRPETRAKNLTDFLQSQGINVLNLPLLELVSCELSEQEKSHLTQINAYQTLIFISETAVTYFFDFIKNYQITLHPNLTFIAVGKKTAQVFQTIWQNFLQKSFSTSPNLHTPSDFHLPENNEGLLQISCIQNLKSGDKILLLKGKDGRELLKNTLLAKDVIVDNVDFYQRVFPPSSVQIFQDFCQSLFYHQAFSTQKIVLITSLTAWENWQHLIQLIQPQFNPNEFEYIVLQQRIADSMAKRIGQKSVITVIDDLQPSTIFNAIQAIQAI